MFNTEKEREETLAKVVRPRKFDILITTYESIKTNFLTLKKIQWETIVVDEAHKIKNDETQVSIALRYYKANFKLLLTGTPLSNNLKELWSLLNFIMPELFDERDLFD